MRSEKKFLADQIGSYLADSDYVYFISYLGLNVKDFSDLRNQLAKQEAKCHVLKNTMIRKSAELKGIAAISDLPLTGGTAMVFGKGDPSAVAKTLVNFGKDHEIVAAKGGFFEGNALSPAQVGEIAKLPSREVLYAMLLGVMQAPARNLVSLLNNKAASVLNVLNAYKDKLEK